MYEAQGVPPQRKSIHWVWGALAGVAVGAGVASGVFWYLMRVQERRHQEQMVVLTAGVADPAALIAQAGQLVSGGGSAINGAKPETTPTKDEIAAYIDGKTLLLPEADNLVLNAEEKSMKSCVIKKDGVEAVQKENGGWRAGDEPWNTNILILYDAGDARYAVERDDPAQAAGQQERVLRVQRKKGGQAVALR